MGRAQTWWLYSGLAFTSGAALVYEIALTRVFAIAQGYHFGFLAISLALLGFGASGTALALGARSGTRSPLTPLLNLAILLPIVLLGSYLVANNLPFDPYLVAWNPIQLVYLVAYLLALTIPFFAVGLIQGLALILWSQHSASLYAANLLGSSVGCLIALAALTWVSVPNVVVVAALMAGVGALALALAENGRRALFPAVELILLVVLLWTSPTLLDIQLSPYKTLNQLLNDPLARVTARYWNAFSRVDVVTSSRIRSAPGLSLSFSGSLPRQTGIVLDADKVLALTSDEKLSSDLFAALPTAIAYDLRPNASALILDPGGGLEVWVALAHEAQSITAVQENPLVAELTVVPFAESDAVRFVTASPRSYSAATAEQFDVVDLALSDNFRPVTAGAFTLGENYTLTVEGVRRYLELLAPRGLLVAQRWLQLPPSEETRMGALIVEALQASGIRDPAQHLVAIRSFSTLLILARREPFERTEIDAVKKFASQRQFDLVYYPGIQASEANHFNKLKQDVYYEAFQNLMADAPQLYRQSAYEIAPPTDEHPFFFHFFKWEQLPIIIALLGKTWQPFGGSGYLILLALLGVASSIAFVLVLLPLWVQRRGLGPGKARVSAGRTLARVLVYFGALGFGFLFVEIPLIQRAVLLLDYPVYGFTVVLFGLLLFSGLGSIVAERVSWRGALIALVLTIALYAALLPLSAWLLAQELIVRVAIVIIVLAPIGFLIGIPFPRGLQFVRQDAPELLPLAWGMNGFTSVISSILATMIALTWGITPVLLGAGVVYAVALLEALNKKSSVDVERRY